MGLDEYPEYIQLCAEADPAEFGHRGMEDLADICRLFALATMAAQAVALPCCWALGAIFATCA